MASNSEKCKTTFICIKFLDNLPFDINYYPVHRAMKIIPYLNSTEEFYFALLHEYFIKFIPFNDYFWKNDGQVQVYQAFFLWF